MALTLPIAVIGFGVYITPTLPGHQLKGRSEVQRMARELIRVSGVMSRLLLVSYL